MSGSFVQALLMDDPYAGGIPIETCVPDPYYNGPDPKTVLLLHMETAVDSSVTPKTVSLVGSAALTTAQSKFGTQSLFVPDAGSVSTGSMIVTDHSDFDFGTGDFTIDLWAYRTTNNFAGYLYSVAVGGSNMTALAWIGTGEVRLRWTTSSSSVDVNTGVAMTTGAWVHHRFQRRGTNFEWYMGGTLRNTQAVPGGASATVNASGDWYFASNNSNPSSQKLNGYIDEVRVVKGIALATGSFTPPTMVGCNSTTDPGFIPVNGTEFPTGQTLTSAQGTLRVANPWVKLSGSAATMSAGSVTVFNPNRSVALTGQTLTASRGSVASPPYPDLFSRATFTLGIPSTNAQFSVGFQPDGTVLYGYGASGAGLPLTLGTWIDTTQTNYVISNINTKYRAVFTNIASAVPPYASVSISTNMSGSNIVTLFHFGTAVGVPIRFRVTVVPTSTNPRYGEGGYVSIHEFNITFTP